VDLPLLAQARPGTKVHFELIDRQKAERLLKQEQKEFHSYLLHY
jgi:allophanate hydrolase subunit 2